MHNYHYRQYSSSHHDKQDEHRDYLELSSKYDDADHKHDLHNDHFFKKEE